MRHKLQLIALIAITSILSSCGGGEEIDLFPVSYDREDIQYVDREGKIVINPQFAEASFFRDGLALVLTSGEEKKYGYITEDGKYAITPQYIAATGFSEGLAWVVTKNSPPSAINKKGEIQFTLQEAEAVRDFKDDLAAFLIITQGEGSGNEKWGFVNKKGEVVINPQFSYANNFSDGLCAVENDDGKWGFIDKDGKIVINYQFTDIDKRFNRFKNGKCVVNLNGKSGVINTEGKYIINPQFDDMVADGDLFMVEQGGKWGWSDTDGKLLINPQFKRAHPFNGSKMAAVRSGKSWGYIDEDGKFFINPQFDYALPFMGNLAFVRNGGKWGFIDKDGKYIVNPQFDDFSTDLYNYMVGLEIVQYVYTDYFNIGAITSLVDFDAPEGITDGSDFSRVSEICFDWEGTTPTGEHFSKYKTRHELYERQITNDAKYKFYVMGKAYDKIKVKKGDGWYTYTETEYRFNGKNKPTGYKYRIALSGRGSGKDEDVILAINNKLELKGYSPSTPESISDGYGNYLHRSKSKEVTTSKDKYGRISIEISFRDEVTK
tara:strand:+ start:4162 stop:5802 length:1641 start_codon:yes stop_codon:yes gene_type:complete